MCPRTLADSSCGNPAFPQLTSPPDLPLTLELLPLEALSRETWLRKPPRSEEGPQGGWGLDHAAESASRPAGAQHVGVVNAVAPSQRGGRQGQHLVSRVRPPRRIPEVEVMVNEFTQAHALGEGGRKEQPRIVDQAVVVEGDLDAIWMRSGCSLFLVGFLSRKPLSHMQRNTFLPLHHAATLISSVDWGLDQMHIAHSSSGRVSNDRISLSRTSANA